MDAQQILLNVGGGLVLLILAWALHSLIGTTGKRIDDLAGALNKRIDDLRLDVTSRLHDVETRLTAMDGSLAAIQKELAARPHDGGAAPGT